jgi:hypothetical protein
VAPQRGLAIYGKDATDAENADPLKSSISPFAQLVTFIASIRSKVGEFVRS